MIVNNEHNSYNSFLYYLKLIIQLFIVIFLLFFFYFSWKLLNIMNKDEFISKEEIINIKERQLKKIKNEEKCNNLKKHCTINL